MKAMIKVNPTHQEVARLAMHLMTLHFIRDAVRESLKFDSVGDLRDALIEAGVLSEEEAYHVRKRSELIDMLIERRHPTKPFEDALAGFGVDASLITFGGE